MHEWIALPEEFCSCCTEQSIKKLYKWGILKTYTIHSLVKKTFCRWYLIWVASHVVVQTIIGVFTYLSTISLNMWFPEKNPNLSGPGLGIESTDSWRWTCTIILICINCIIFLQSVVDWARWTRKRSISSWTMVFFRQYSKIKTNAIGNSIIFIDSSV